MSKIEKALQRARGEQKLALVTSRPSAPEAETTNDNRQLITAPNRGAPLVELEARARSSAAIALMRETRLLDKNALARYNIIYPELSDDPTVQAFREIRTKILQKTMGRNAVIMVTGVGKGSGSTFVSINLSAAFAFDAGKTALMVDCNLRSPSLHKLLPEGGAPGLTDYLENSDMDPANVIHSVGIERLRVIPAGGNREIPAEYFTSIKMKRLLETVRQRYAERFVILDAPPMTESADTRILTELCDYVLLVVPYGKVTDSQIGDCIKAIDANKLLGVVFNDEPRVPLQSWKQIFVEPFVSLGRLILGLARNKKTKAA